MNNNNFANYQNIFNINKRLKSPRKRYPGHYPDKYSIKKDENNTLILHSCKLLKSYYNDGIKALILDGKEMRTTKSLKYLGDRLKELIIVEYNKETYSIINNEIKSDKYIRCYNHHINDYINNYNTSKINLVYFDLMENFFSSQNSLGSEFPIKIFLSKSEVNELIFASTFCLRNAENMNYQLQVDKILDSLDDIFNKNKFEKTQLIPKNNMRYKGQRGANKSLMFVLYYLKKHKDNSKNENIIY